MQERSRGEKLIAAARLTSDREQERQHHSDLGSNAAVESSDRTDLPEQPKSEPYRDGTGKIVKESFRAYDEAYLESLKNRDYRKVKIF